MLLLSLHALIIGIQQHQRTAPCRTTIYHFGSFISDISHFYNKLEIESVFSAVKNSAVDFAF